MTHPIRGLAGVVLFLILLVAGALVGFPTRAQTQGVPVDAKSISGVVLNKGQTPEAGVWVIAETDSLPTHFRRIVVTDDQGRFLVPDLPDGAYDVWVRGYGLRDSKPTRASRGGRVTLQVTNARNPQEAARIYPANYWLSLYQPPPQHELPGQYTGQDHWIAQMKLGCMLCHQVGAELTRIWTKPEDWDVLWDRVKGSIGMPKTAEGLGKDPLKKSLAAWASRIADGEVPPAPPRPAGLERNVVVTQWNWGRDDSYIHDEVATDKRNPLLYPYGKVYGVDIGQDILWALDPVKNEVLSYKIPTRQGYGRAPSEERRYNNPANPHNPMLDDTGKVWMTTQVRGENPEDRPKWAKNVISADIVADDGVSIADKLASEDEGNHHRQLGYFDTKTQQMVLIDTAYGTHHLQFDKEGRVWTSGDSTALGMFIPKEFDPKRPETEALAQRAWMNIDPKTNKPVPSNFPYGIIVNPVDGTVWRAHPGSGGNGNKISKFDPRTKTFKDYPLAPPGRGPRGIDATTDGKLWFGTGSGHLGRFDPKTEQFTYWESPGPKIKGMGKETGSADFHYYIWVDQFNTLGLGKDLVILTGTDSDSLIIFDPKKETFTVFRIPFPLGMYHRGLDGRIDDPAAGWKGRGLWVDDGQDPIFFSEKKIGFLNHIQLRPDPLAP